VIAFVIGSAFDILTRLISGTIPQTPGPISGLIATLVVVLLLVAVVRIGGPLLVAALEAIPIVGGPISTLLGRFL
jgi:hypothetical protein